MTVTSEPYKAVKDLVDQMLKMNAGLRFAASESVRFRFTLYVVTSKILCYLGVADDTFAHLCFITV